MRSSSASWTSSTGRSRLSEISRTVFCSAGQPARHFASPRFVSWRRWERPSAGFGTRATSRSSTIRRTRSDTVVSGAPVRSATSLGVSGPNAPITLNVP